ncbi:type 1 fimbrial protein [Pseudomonas yamanorum]|uniref:type 1 fimbrial protein n=1 Tax=Pseudomonas yamanorum TaxID=515393 RepID=UPI001C46D101|nr:type 1 fimbrial protein [Pseudomonas yamanorum]MBV6664172.1 type 1 fimbrial protein [Pseudomonas yamanorum]
MSIKGMPAICVGLLFGVSGVCMAASSAGQGVIYFHGSIVEPSCTPLAVANGLKLNDCPALARGSAISVRSVEPVSSVSALDHSAVSVKLVSDSGRENSYYQQQYSLVDSQGKPVNSGKYLVTLTSP